MISNELGQLVTTKAVADLREKDKDFDRFATLCFCRYRDNDWGDLEDEDKMLNDQALKSGDESIMASYAFPPDASWDATNEWGMKNNKLWIITEGNHSATTILFPSDY